MRDLAREKLTAPRRKRDPEPDARPTEEEPPPIYDPNDFDEAQDYPDPDRFVWPEDE